MATGTVNPFSPNQPTQAATPGAAANSLLTFQPCDSLLIYNSGAVLVFVAFATALNLYGATPVLTGGMPVPPGSSLLVGVPGVAGVQSDPIVQIALLAASSGAGAVYVTPGLGTQR